MSIRNRFLLVISIISVNWYSILGENEVSDSIDILESLVGVISDSSLSSQIHSEEEEFYSDIKSIVYSKSFTTSKKEIGASDVLSFLTNVYSDHGYHDSGNWSGGTKSLQKIYIPYPGDLPHFTIEDFKLPVKGKLTSIYGYRPKFKRFHHGIDVALNPGDTVKCTLPGIVTRTGYQQGGYGRFVMVSHADGVETLYGHLQYCIVEPGQYLSAGEALGIGGSSGNATGPHLHFETRYRGVPIDPITWFNIEGKFK